jgi:hypothetical protein
MVALTIEHCNLHKRTALRVLLFVGASPRWFENTKKNFQDKNLNKKAIEFLIKYLG